MKRYLESMVRIWSDVPRNTRIACGVALLVLIIGVVYGVAVHFQDDTVKQARREGERLVAAVGKLMVLPDEEPIIVTVTNPEEFDGQPYFTEAMVGDRILIYNVARKAILFRVQEQRIVDIAPLSPSRE